MKDVDTNRHIRCAAEDSHYLFDAICVDMIIIWVARSSMMADEGAEF